MIWIEITRRVGHCFREIQKKKIVFIRTSFGDCVFWVMRKYHLYIDQSIQFNNFWIQWQTLKETAHHLVRLFIALPFIRNASNIDSGKHSLLFFGFKWKLTKLCWKFYLPNTAYIHRITREIIAFHKLFQIHKTAKFA